MEQALLWSSAFIVAHVALVAAAYTRGLFFTLIAAFCVLSPLSAAVDLPFVEAAKYARFYVTILVVVIGFFHSGVKLGIASKALLCFLLLYATAALWSDRPIQGFAFKGLAVFAVAAGLYAGSSACDPTKLRYGLRYILCAGGVLSFLILTHLIMNPNAVSHIGRLASWGINSNRIGQTAAPLAIVAFYFGLLDTHRRWRVVGWTVYSSLSVIVMYTGSRASFGMLIIGSVILAFSLSRRMVRLVFSIVAASIVIFTALQFIDTGTGRLNEVSVDTRAADWESAWESFKESPLVGHGWDYVLHREGGSTLNRLSIYLQIMSETGLLGTAAFAIILVIFVTKYTSAWRSLINHPELLNFWYLSTAVTCGVLAHGLFESSVLMGSTINTVLIGISVAMIDQLKAMADQYNYFSAQSARELL